MDRAIAALRAGTVAFINQDPTVISLTPRVETKQASGASVWTDGTPREPQTFKLISQGFTAHGAKRTVTLSGTERTIDYVLMGTWDAVVEVGDHWTDDNGRRFTVISLDDGHGYELKANVEAHG